MANPRARAFMQQKSMENRRDLLDQWETLQDENVESQSFAAWGKLFGEYTLPVLMNTLIPGMTLVQTMVAAGLGSKLGSETGELLAGHGGVRGSEAINPVGGQSELRRSIEGNAEDAYGGFSDQQNIAALKSGLDAFSLGGGDIKAPLQNLNKPIGSDTLYNMFNRKV